MCVFLVCILQLIGDDISQGISIFSCIIFTTYLVLVDSHFYILFFFHWRKRKIVLIMYCWYSLPFIKQLLREEKQGSFILSLFDPVQTSFFAHVTEAEFTQHLILYPRVFSVTFQFLVLFNIQKKTPNLLCMGEALEKSMNTQGKSERMCS